MRTVDVSYKLQTLREAKAYGRIKLSKECLEKIKEKKLPKGDCIEATKLAGIYGAKHTPMLLPFCHPIGFDHVEMELNIGEDFIEVFATVRGIARTGYEMEALTAVITVSDRASKGVYEDKSGKLLMEKLKELQSEVVFYKVVPDEEKEIQRAIEEALKEGAEIVITTGGTGLSPRDITPEAVEKLAVKEIKGFGEAMRVFGSQYTPKALVSRASAYVLPEGAIVLVLPGSRGAVNDYMNLLGGLLKHALDMAKGKGH